MRASQVIDLFECKKSAKSGNYESDGKSLFLFGNEIAQHREDGIYISLAGWNSNTTKKALNYLSGVDVSSRSGNIKLNGTLINSQDWFKVQ